MKANRSKLHVIVLFIGALLLAAPAMAEPALTFDHFYTHAELTNALNALTQSYPKLATLQSIGKSAQGRELWAITIFNPDTGPAERKPGFYIDGNIHGNEVQGAEVALYAAYYLLTQYGKSEQVTRLLDEKVFYIIPTMNPDSRDYFIRQAVNPNYPRGGLVPYDDDRDGACDEDGPDDLDGDGSITMMRKKDPDGNLRAWPGDPRILLPVRPGEKGEYTLLGYEGIDNDGDGQVNEDGPGGYDMNRDYGFDWQPDYIQRGAGNYPFSWPETRAIRDFLLAHPNIAGAQNFHNNGGYILRGPGAPVGGAADYPAADARVYDYIGKRGEKILPGYKYAVTYKDLYAVHGGSLDFLHNTLGIFAFTNELDPEPPEVKGPDAPPAGDETDAYFARIKREMGEEFFYENVMGAQYVADWKPYHHPLYGDIEIGGVKKFGDRVPPAFRLAETCHRNVMFCLFHADQLPHLKITELKATALEGGLHRIDVTIENERATPTMSATAAQGKLHRADRLMVRGEGVKLLAAGEVSDKHRNQTSRIRCRQDFFFVEGGAPGFERRHFSMLVKGQGEATLVYDSLKGGWLEQSVTLK